MSKDTSVTSPAKDRKRLRRDHAVLLLSLVWMLLTAASPAQGQAPLTTFTALAASASTVAPNTPVKLTAAVTANGTPLTSGQVKFCDAAISCTDIHLLGTAQLTVAGTATISLVPGIGSYSYIAVFQGTSADAPSTSTALFLTVTGSHATQSSLVASGQPGRYTLTATLTASGDATASPSGVVSFLDTSAGNQPLGPGVPLVPGPTTVTFPTVLTNPTGSFPQTAVTGDFNGDGKVDLAYPNGGDGTLTVLLGNGDGTFTAAPTVGGTGNNPFGIAVGDFNGDGKQDIVVADPVNPPFNSGVAVFLGNGDGTFAPGNFIDIPGYTNSVAVGDFNGDGIQDLAVAVTGDDAVAILQGNGDGTFTQLDNTTEVDGGATWVTVSDFNGDGKADIAVAGATVSILLGNGDGTFTLAPTPAAANYQVYLQAADLNGDGIPDLVTANYADNSVSILLGNGDGTFSASTINNPQLSNPYALTIADFNGDGKPDIATANFGNNTSSILLGNGDGTFTVSGDGLSVPGITYITAADFNGDGIPDLAAASAEPNLGTILLGARTLSATATLLNVSPSGVGTDLATAVYAGDTNFTGSTSNTVPLTDLPPSTTTLTVTAAGNAVTTVASGTVVTLTATVIAEDEPVTSGTVTFCDATAPLCENSAVVGTAQLTPAGTAALTFVPAIGSHSYNAVFIQTVNAGGSTSTTQPLTATGAYPTQTTVAATGTAGNYTLTATVVGTGETSLVPTGRVVFTDTTSSLSLGTVPLGVGTAGLSFLNSSNPTTGNNAQSVATGDFNGDGLADMVVANGNDNNLTVFLSKGDGTFTTVPTNPATGDNPVLRAVGDFNGDGKLDLAVADVYGGSLTILLGNGDGTFTPAASQPEVSEPISIAIGDFNHDGIPDLAVANYAINAVTILIGNGDGTFNALDETLATGASPYSIVTADFNHDGNLDLAVANYVGQNVTILLGNGDGTFTAAASPASGTATYFIATGDFNGDGNPDLAVVNNGDSNLTILLGNGDGTFTPAASPATGLYPQGAVVADLNGDGKADIAVPNYQGIVTVLLGNGDGTFTAAAASPATGGGASTIASGDFNGDGVPDLAVSDGTSNFVAVLLTQRTETATAVLSNVNPTGIGTHDVEAAYPGDTNFGASTSPAAPITLALPPAIIRSSIATGSSIPYGPLLVTVTLTGTGQTNTIPTGTITYFLDNLTTPVAVPGMLVNGSITFTLPQIAVGNHFIDFAYSGDTNYAGTPNQVPPAPQAIPFSVTKVSDTVTLTAMPSPVRTPNPITLYATLTSAATGATGTVNFMDGATSLGQAPLSAAASGGPAGAATLSGVILAPGPHNLTALYSGDPNFQPATSSAASLVVEPLAVVLTSIAPAAATAGAANTTITATGANFTAASVVNFNGAPLVTTFVNAATLQAVIPAASLTTTRNATVTVTDTSSASASVPAAFTILPALQATFSGPPTANPGDQPALAFQLQQAFPAALNVTITLTFTPNAGNPDDPQVQFATGSRIMTFTLPANTTTMPAIMLQAGTVSGTISASLQLTSNGADVTPASIAPITIAVAETAPTLTSVTVTASGNTLTVLVTGYSSTREVSQGTFTFTPISGVTLTSTTVTVPAAPLFQTWYSDTSSIQYGSTFTYTQTFDLSAPASQIAGVSVSLTNSKGASAPVTTP